MTGGITLPDTLKFIGASAFKNCNGLISSTWDVDKKISKDANNIYYLKNSYKYFCIGNYSNITDGSGSSPIRIDILNGTIIIGDDAFTGLRDITQVGLTIPNSVISIGSLSFEGLTGVTYRLTIPASVTYINTLAFAVCNHFDGLVFDNFSNNPSHWNNQIFLGWASIGNVFVSGNFTNTWNASIALNYAKSKALPDGWTNL